ncbi:MAG: DHA2 family efflux MFS transporter permease subunit [Micrococcales bacterium]
MAKLLFNRWIGLVFISMAISLVIIDGTIVNNIFPKVIQALSLSSTEVQWVQESYVLVFASLLLVWGSIADRFGRRLLLLIGVLIFIGASVWCGLSEDASTLILARVIQGIGGSMVLPTTLSLVNANFQGKERGIAFAVWGSTIGGMVALGPVIGGWLASIDENSWRLAFNVNLPIGLVIVVGLLLFVHESKVEIKDKSLDFVGAAISVIMFLTLVFGLIEGRAYGWLMAKSNNPFELGDFKWPTDGISVIPISLAISAIFFALFYFWERRQSKRHKNVLLDLDLFHISSFRNGSIAALIISMGEFGLLFALPLWLQNVQGLSPIDSGLVLLWLAGGAFLASGAGGAMSGKVAPVTAVRAGVMLELLGVIATGLAIYLGQGWGWVAPGLLLYGIGVGLATAQLTGVIMVDVPAQKIGQASGSQSTVRQIGSALGIAVLGTALFSATESSMTSRLSDVAGLPEEAKSGLVSGVVDSAGGIIPSLKDILTAQQIPAETAQQVSDIAGQSFSDGAWMSAVAAGVFLLLGFLATFRLEKRHHGH